MDCTLASALQWGTLGQRNWNEKVGSQKKKKERKKEKVGSQGIPGVTGKYGLGLHNEAGQRLTELCKENTVVIANIFQQSKR